MAGYFQGLNMKTKHTPGPWVWSYESHHQCGNGKWLESQSGMVLDYDGCGSHECKVTQADARLIAAAPELLEALKNLMYYDNGKSEWEAAWAAIVKATR